jgi:hypothetical protein
MSEFFCQDLAIVTDSYNTFKPSECDRLEDPEVKDVDFCPHTAAAAVMQHQQQQQQQQQSGFELLATVGGNGVCQIWQVEPNQQRLVAKLEPPKGASAVGPKNRV